MTRWPNHNEWHHLSARAPHPIRNAHNCEYIFIECETHWFLTFIDFIFGSPIDSAYWKLIDRMSDISIGFSIRAAVLYLLEIEILYALITRVGKKRETSGLNSK